MKNALFTFALFLILLPLSAEVRTGVYTEFYNTVASLDGIDGDWSYTLGGQAGISFRNTGSRSVRGEIALDLAETGPYLTPSLKRLYIRPSFGGVLVSVGKTRSTWGAGFAFNAGDIIFGSESVDFDARSSDPRTETAWLTNIQIPIGAFSFIEGIVLPGNIDVSNPLNPVLPTLSKTSAGGRLSVEAGIFNLQAGYLYRGDLIAALGSTGHRVFLSVEGIAPIDWHISSSATTDIGSLVEETVKSSWMITGGVSYDHKLGQARDVSLGWVLEFLAKPFGAFEEEGGETEYGLFLFPSLTFIPPGNVAYGISSIVSPVDMSANTTVSVNWNIYEELELLGYYSLQTGGDGDTFSVDNTGGMGFTVGARYSY